MGADAAAEEQFGPYLVYERLGVGGMATVHRALERGMEGFERVVALKRLLPHLASDASFIKAFVREAKLASLLNHNNIVNIFELGRVASHYFISMEYIDGRDVRRLLRHARKVTGPPPIHVTVGILLQLCDALDYAHHKVDDAGHPLGLVHRDVSPSNVLETSTGQIKVIDFGIAKAQGAQRTQTGRVKGKLAYMAPEALTGKELDARSDLFAAGVIAHELLTARPLFASKNEYQTLMKVQRAEVMPPSTFNQQCPLELDAIVLRALARDPDDRFGDASELRDELHAMRKQYGLATAQRDIAAWVDWAFGLGTPATPGGVIDPPRATAMRARPRPSLTDEDEAVELAWGGNDEVHDGRPVVLDDVPDVSGKHLAADPSALGAEVRLDLDDLADDIPTPLPSHGGDEPDNRPTMLHIPRPTRARLSDERLAAPAPAPRATAARPAAQDVPTPNLGVGVGVRSVMIPPRVRTITIPPRMMPTASVAPRSHPPTEPPPRSRPSSSSPPRPLAPSTSPRIPSSSAGPRRPAGPTPARHVPSADPTAYESNPTMVAHEPRDVAATERTPRLAIEELGLGGETVPAVPAVQSSEPIVRFREPTMPPPFDDEPPYRPSVHLAPPALPEAGARDGLMPSDPKTEPMAEPPSAPLYESGHGAVRSLTRRRRLITPATALFAEPEPDTEGNPRAVASSGVQHPQSGAPVGAAALALPRVVVLVAAIVLLATTAAAVTWLITRRSHAPTPVVPPPAPPPRATSTIGTIRFVTVPADSAITITGQPGHAGSPWDVTLPFGRHQVEIHRDGYKGWLTTIDVAAGERQTVHVELERLGSAVMADATLIVAAPPGLETTIDGVVVAPTPARLAIKPGPHTVALRRGGVELWTKRLDAGAGTIYELHPTLPGDAPEVTASVQEPVAAAPPAIDETVAEPAALPPVTVVAIPAPPPAPPAPIVGPVNVAPGAVAKLSGPTPNVTTISAAALPERISAKLCIDAAGGVTSAELLVPVASAPAAEIIGALRHWRYTPYKLDGAPHAACFAVAFRVK